MLNIHQKVSNRIVIDTCGWVPAFTLLTTYTFRFRKILNCLDTDVDLMGVFCGTDTCKTEFTIIEGCGDDIELNQGEYDLIVLDGANIVHRDTVKVYKERESCFDGQFNP